MSLCLHVAHQLILLRCVWHPRAPTLPHESMAWKYTSFLLTTWTVNSQKASSLGIEAFDSFTFGRVEVVYMHTFLIGQIFLVTESAIDCWHVTQCPSFMLAVSFQHLFCMPFLVDSKTGLQVINLYLKDVYALIGDRHHRLLQGNNPLDTENQQGVRYSSHTHKNPALTFRFLYLKWPWQLHDLGQWNGRKAYKDAQNVLKLYSQ